MIESQIVSLLRAKYGGNDWALFPQVPDGTGLSKKRTADAIAMSLWPSRGLEIHGFEIKVERGDWLKEVNGTGEKAESVARFCDRWWIVAPSGIVKKDELPSTWGLLTATESGLRTAVQAPVTDSEPLTRQFIAGLFRAAGQFYSSGPVLQAQYDAGLKEGRERERRERQYQRTGAEHAQKRLEDLSKCVNEFEATSGVSIRHGWGSGRVGEAVRLVLNGGIAPLKGHALDAKRNAERIIEAADSLLAIETQLEEH